MSRQRKYISQPKHKRLSDVISQNAKINRSRSLKGLLARAESTMTLSKRLDECLPSKLQGAFTVAALDQGCLTLHCHSAAIATRFRMEQDKILTALQMRIGATRVSKFQIQIRPHSVNKQQGKTKTRQKPKTEITAGNLEERLENALERLQSRSSE